MTDDTQIVVTIKRDGRSVNAAQGLLLGSYGSLDTQVDHVGDTAKALAEQAWRIHGRASDDRGIACWPPAGAES